MVTVTSLDQQSTASSGVDEQSLHSVAHSKSLQDEKMREGVYTKYAKPEQCARSISSFT